MIQKLKELNEDINDAQTIYNESRLKLKVTEAELWLETNWEEELGNKKPTIKDKESWITTQIDYLREEVNEHQALLEYLKREFEIMKLEVQKWADKNRQDSTGQTLESQYYKMTL